MELSSYLAAHVVLHDVNGALCHDIDGHDHPEWYHSGTAAAQRQLTVVGNVRVRPQGRSELNKPGYPKHTHSGMLKS